MAVGFLVKAGTFVLMTGTYVVVEGSLNRRSGEKKILNTVIGAVCGYGAGFGFTMIRKYPHLLPYVAVPAGAAVCLGATGLSLYDLGKALNKRSD